MEKSTLFLFLKNAEVQLHIQTLKKVYVFNL